MDNAQNGYSSVDNTGKIKKTYCLQYLCDVSHSLNGKWAREDPLN